MKIRIKHYFGYFLSLLIFAAVLFVVFYSYPKVVFLQSRAEINLVRYDYKNFKDVIVIETADAKKAEEMINKFNNSSLLLSPVASKNADITSPYFSFSAFEDSDENTFELDFSSFVKSFENVAVLDNSLDSLSFDFDSSVKVYSYSDFISDLEIDEYRRLFNKDGIENVIITNLSESKALFALDNVNFYLPKGGELIFKGNNIFVYSPDIDSIINAIVNGDFTSPLISYKTYPSLK